jgi:signal transduction histidine kinase
VDWDEPTRQDFVREIDQEADVLDGLINDLLDTSCLASGAHQNLRLAPTSPALLVNAGLDRLRSHMLALAGIVIDPELEALPPVHVDASRIQQVLANLLEHAAKYAPGTVIRLSGRVASAGRRVELWVEDEGPGIPVADLPHIFEKFIAADHPGGPEYQASGWD